jgi:hypothetical protein
MASKLLVAAVVLAFAVAGVVAVGERAARQRVCGVRRKLGSRYRFLFAIAVPLGPPALSSPPCASLPPYKPESKLMGPLQRRQPLVSSRSSCESRHLIPIFALSARPALRAHLIAHPTNRGRDREQAL